MQTKEQWKRPKDWKVVGAVAAASALGLSGLALAGPDESGSRQGGISLDDQASFSEVSVPSSVPTTVAEAMERVADSADLDSPFDDDDDGGGAGEGSGQTDSAQSPPRDQSAQSPAAVDADSPGGSTTTTRPVNDDSPDSADAPPTTSAPAEPDSADSPASVQPEPESPDSADSPASPQPEPESPDSPDGSADSGDDGSADS